MAQLMMIPAQQGNVMGILGETTCHWSHWRKGLDHQDGYLYIFKCFFSGVHNLFLNQLDGPSLSTSRGSSMSRSR